MFCCPRALNRGEKTPEGWKQGASIPGVRYLWDRKQASDGTSSLGFRKTANRYFPIAAWTHSVERSGKLPALTLSAQVKARKASKAVIDVLFIDEGGDWIKHEWAAYIGQKQAADPLANHDWKRYSGSVMIPDNAQQIVVGLQMYGPGQVWFDELEVHYTNDVSESE